MIKIRPQKITDALPFYRMLNNLHFQYLPVVINSLEEEMDFLKRNAAKRKAKKEYNFSILYGEKIVGAVGVRRNETYRHVGEAGYFVDEEYWGKGIACVALELLEQFIKTHTDMKRIELQIAMPNQRSIRVAIKCGYKKEAVLKRRMFLKGKYYDANLFVKFITKI